MQITEFILCTQNTEKGEIKKNKNRIKRRRTETDRAEKQVCSREEKKGLETCCDYLHTWHTSLISVSGITHLLAKRHIQTSNCSTFTTETSVNRDCKLGNDTKQRFCSVSASSFVGPKCLLIIGFRQCFATLTPLQHCSVHHNCYRALLDAANRLS